MPEMDGFAFIEHYALLPEFFRKKCIVTMLSSTDDINDIERVNNNPNIASLIKKPLHPSKLQKLMAGKKF